MILNLKIYMQSKLRLTNFEFDSNQGLYKMIFISAYTIFEFKLLRATTFILPSIQFEFFKGLLIRFHLIFSFST